jgi:hypothetical protein
MIDAHIIEVKPTYCYERDTQYKYEQINIQVEFKKLFPYEEILFMTENVLFQIENPILSLGTENNIVVSNSNIEKATLIDVTYTQVTPIEYMICTTTNQITEFANSYSVYNAKVPDIVIKERIKLNWTELIKNSIIKPQKKDSEIKNQSLFFYYFVS